MWVWMLAKVIERWAGKTFEAKNKGPRWSIEHHITLEGKIKKCKKQFIQYVVNE